MAKLTFYSVDVFAEERKRQPTRCFSRRTVADGEMQHPQPITIAKGEFI